MNDSLFSCIKCCTAIAAIAGIELFAIKKGKNGTTLRLVIGAIATIAGFTIAEILKSH
jgi:hypothetical protein